MLLVSVLSCLLVTASASWFDRFNRRAVINGVPCSKNQVIRTVKHYNDIIEFECGPIPCGEFGIDCVDDQNQCQTEHNYFLSGMRGAPNNNSILLRCCKLQTKKKPIYVGTDKISYAYYEGGKVNGTELYDKNGGAEYDFVANARAETYIFCAGVRVWIYRILCEKGEEPIIAAPELTNSVVEEEEASGEASGEEQTNEAKDASKITVIYLPRPSSFPRKSNV
ncbi:hypothetical protein CAEBREN_19018 [Caenorhabditis brenneri]|uniref:Uncharacterized protein n=1 Tax=Caenorhabditis brenneri TaxID=135651 RepID=G0N1L2_CAEBE|nr:hypothetical protein CAEBREN_19018 [Caenorhabditis brenneri]